MKKSAVRVRLLAAVTAACGAIGSVHAAVNTLSTFTSGTALDSAGDWTPNGIPTANNDALFTSAYPNSVATQNISTGTNISFGSFDDTSTSYAVYITGNPSSNTSTNNITIGGGGANGVAPASSDLIYAATGSEIDFRTGGTAYTFGSTVVNISVPGNFDAVGTGEIVINSKVLDTSTLTKTGTGLLALADAASNATNISGGIILQAGTLQVQSGSALGYSPTNGLPELTFAGSSTLQVTSTAGFGAARIFNISNGSVATIDSDGQTFGLQNPIMGSGSLVKIGTGTITFNSSSGYTYTGTTTINGGAIALNVSSAIPTTALTLGNSGSLYLDSGYRFNQSFPSVTLNPGSSVISAPMFNVSGQTLGLGVINRSSYSLIDFVTPSNGTITTTTPNSNFSGGQPTILGGWATANGETSWAASAGSNTAAGAITPLPQGSYDQTFAVPGADVDVVSSSNVASPVTVINSLRFNTGSSITLTPSTSLTIASGGLLQTANVGSAFNFISGGTLTSGSGELDVIQADASAFLTITSNIVDSTTPVALVKGGAGQLLLGGSNTFSGPTYVNAGILGLESQLALQNSTLTAGTVIFESGTDTVTIGGIGTSSNISLLDTSSSPVALTFGGNNATTTFSGIFTGAGSLTKVGTGLTYLANGNSTFTGGFTIDSGTIQFISGGSFGGNQNVSGAQPVTIMGGAAILYNGSGACVWGATRGFTLGPGVVTVQIGSITTATNTSTSSLTLGVTGNASSGIIAGPSSGVAILNKTGLGTLILDYDNTYNGGTNVSEGTVDVASPNALGVSTLGSGYTGSGPLAIIPSELFATVNFQTSSVAVSSLTNYVNGNASAGAASISLGSPVVNGSTALTIGADGTSTTFSGNISDISANYSGAVGSIIKVGTGVLTLSGTNSYTGSTNVSAGGLVLASAAALPANSTLTIAPGAGVTIANHGSGATCVPTLSLLSNSGTLDITNNAMIIHNGSIGTIFSEIQSAYNGGAWTGTNASAGVITSSAAAADTTFLTAVGVATGLTGFEGQTVLPTDVLVKYTYYGDANLDGKVDGSDYSRIDNGFVNNLTGWSNGDFNYDGVINGSDYTLIDNDYNTQGADLAASVASTTAQIAAAALTPVSAVPEPSILEIISLSGIGMLSRRRRR